MQQLEYVSLDGSFLVFGAFLPIVKRNLCL